MHKNADADEILYSTYHACHQISLLILSEVLKELINKFYSPWKSPGFLMLSGGIKV